jgi:uncharacterized protein YjbI with pentapeptide repeats
MLSVAYLNSADLNGANLRGVGMSGAENNQVFVVTPYALMVPAPLHGRVMKCR